MERQFTTLSFEAQALWFHLLMMAERSAGGWLIVPKEMAAHVRQTIGAGADAVRELMAADWVTPIGEEGGVSIGVWALPAYGRLVPCKDLLGGDDNELDQSDREADG